MRKGEERKERTTINKNEEEEIKSFKTRKGERRKKKRGE